ETEELYFRAAAKGILICPDFIQLFHPLFQNACTLIDSNQLGAVVHVEASMGVDLNLAELRESKGIHWIFTLPGGIIRSSLCHPVYLSLYFLGAPQRVTATSRSLGTLPQGLIDHLSVMIEGERCTASLVVSAAVNPDPYTLKIFCERGTVIVNFDTSALQ